MNATRQVLKFVLVLVCLAIASAEGKAIVVNTTNNLSPGPNETNLAQAIALLADGDTIDFDIPGNGPFYLITPPLSPNNGYPAITNNNIIIDGFSQPGAMPNGDPILSSNNARYQIVLDSRGGGYHIQEMPGYSDHEGAVLFVNGATNVQVRGLCFLGSGTGPQNNATPTDPNTYAVSFAQGASFGRVSGCQIGVDLDGQSVWRFCAGVTGFEGNAGVYIDSTTIGVGLDATNSSQARAEFNVIVGGYIPIVLEGSGHRIAGNFINVFPSGQSDYQCDGYDPYNIQACIEIGESGNNITIGTDGNGVNDADERNVFGGVTWADDGELLEWYDSGGTNVVVAGNYFGLAVDGVTRFTNAEQVLGGLHGSTRMRFGSDFAGPSAALEGNLVAMNYPFDWLYPSPVGSSPPPFADIQTGGEISFRGNSLIGNNVAPISYDDGQTEAFLNFYQGFVATNAILPVLDANSSQGILRGSCGLGIPPYTNVVIDLYLADDEGWTNGQQFEFPELSYTDPATGGTEYYGFAQGRTWLAAFTENGPQDLNPAPGQFAFDISQLNISTNALITATASYSADAPGTPHAQFQTTPFAYDITLQAAPPLAIALSSGAVVLSWPANAGMFGIQTATSLSSGWAWISPPPFAALVGARYEATIPAPQNPAFFRLVGF